jgi:hypothetical protein
MKPPRCNLYPPSARYRRKVVRSLRYDGETLEVDIQGEGFAFARVVFRHPVGFRVLDTYSEPNGWLYEVKEGGWLELETHRQLFNSPDVIPGLTEYLVVDDKCVSVLAVGPPDIIDLGADPEQAGA